MCQTSNPYGFGYCQLMVIDPLLPFAPGMELGWAPAPDDSVTMGAKTKYSELDECSEGGARRDHGTRGWPYRGRSHRDGDRFTTLNLEQNPEFAAR